MRCLQPRAGSNAVNGFSSTAGGALCPLCRGREPDQRELSAAALSVLRRLQSGGLAGADSVRMSQETRTEIELILSEYITSRLEHDLNSAVVLRNLRRQIAAYGVWRLRCPPGQRQRMPCTISPTSRTRSMSPSGGISSEMPSTRCG